MDKRKILRKKVGTEGPSEENIYEGANTGWTYLGIYGDTMIYKRLPQVVLSTKGCEETSGKSLEEILTGNGPAIITQDQLSGIVDMLDAEAAKKSTRRKGKGSGGGGKATRRMAVDKTKIITVKLNGYETPEQLQIIRGQYIAQGFVEVSIKPEKLRRAPKYLYFAKRVSAVEAVAVPAVPVAQGPGAGAGNMNNNNNNYGNLASVHSDNSLANIVNQLAETGVSSQGEFEALALLLEEKARIADEDATGGGGGKRRRKSRKRTSQKNRTRRH